MNMTTAGGHNAMGPGSPRETAWRPNDRAETEEWCYNRGLSVTTEALSSLDHRVYRECVSERLQIVALALSVSHNPEATVVQLFSLVAACDQSVNA